MNYCFAFRICLSGGLLFLSSAHLDNLNNLINLIINVRTEENVMELDGFISK